MGNVVRYYNPGELVIICICGAKNIPEKNCIYYKCLFCNRILMKEGKIVKSYST